MNTKNGKIVYLQIQICEVLSARVDLEHNQVGLAWLIRYPFRSKVINKFLLEFEIMIQAN